MKKILTVIVLLTSIIGFSGCKDDVMEEITELNLDRNLSPTDVTATVFNKTSIRLAWKAVRTATSYNVEIYDNAEFSGTPVKSLNEVPFNQVPVNFTDLEFGTEYFARVQAIGGDVNDSKWMTVSFTTDMEQILNEIDDGTVTWSDVTLTWPAGEAATSIVLTPGDITYTLTAGDKEKGEATITGLAEKTAYTATLMNGEKIRGRRTFTTKSNSAIAVTPADDLQALIDNAKEDDVFVLAPGNYSLNKDVIINKSVSIQAAQPANKPVLGGVIFRIGANAGLALKDLILDGTGAKDNNQSIIYADASDNVYAPLAVQNCEIKNYVKGVMYVNVKALIESVSFKNNLIHDVQCNGGDFIDFRNGLAKTFLFENNTVYNSASSRDVFRMDAGGSGNFPNENSIITIRTNTFYKVATSTNRYLYIRLANHQIHFTRNLIANTSGYYTNQGSTKITTLADNNYFEAPNFTVKRTDADQIDEGRYTSLNPQFASPDEGNFTLGNQDLKISGIGAARWR